MPEEPSGKSDCGSNGWDEWKRYVLGELKRTSDYTKETRDKIDAHYILAQKETLEKQKESLDAYKSLSEEISEIKADIRGLQIKAGVWGLAGGAIPVGIALLIYVFEVMAH